MNDVKSKLAHYAKIVLGVIVGFIILLIVLGTVFSGDKDKKTETVKNIEQPANTTPIPTKAARINTMGQEGYLRLPDNNDPSQLIVLGETKEAQSQITKSLIANDTQGLIEIPNILAVPVGSKILIIDFASGIKRVRILEVPDQKYSDKVGKTGWAPIEYLFAQ